MIKNFFGVMVLGWGIAGILAMGYIVAQGPPPPIGLTVAVDAPPVPPPSGNYLDYETGATPLAASGTGWHIEGNGGSAFAFNSAAQCPIAQGSRGLAYNWSVSGTGALEYDWTRTTKASIGVCIKITFTDSGYHSGPSISDGTGDFVSMMIQGGKIYLESGACPNCAPLTGSFFSYTPNTWYWLTEYYEKAPGTLRWNLYNMSGVLLSSQTKAAKSGDSGPNFLRLGNIGDGSANGFVYYDHFVKDTVNGVFPLMP